MSLTIVTDFICPCCSHQLHRSNTQLGVVLHCRYRPCRSAVCDNGCEAQTEFESYGMLQAAFDNERLEDTVEELSIDDEREQEEARKGDMELDRQRGEP